LTVELAGGTRWWNSLVELNGGTVERWNGGTPSTIRLSAGSSQRLRSLSLVLVSLVVVLARFRAFLRVVIPNEFQPDWARIGLEQ
jgi:hypothetical protein